MNSKQGKGEEGGYILGGEVKRRINKAYEEGRLQ